jgi:hypothetical protein
MACLLAPAAVAIVTTSIRKKIDPKYHLNWLNTMLWGGVATLTVEHVAHGEIVPYPPFLTAMQNPADIPVMLGEIVTIGTAMTIAIFIVWAMMVFVANKMPKIQEKKKYKLGLLGLMLWGSAIMILVDNLLSYKSVSFSETGTISLINTALNAL